MIRIFDAEVNRFVVESVQNQYEQGV